MINKIFKKKSSPYEVKFSTSEEDSWFINITTRKIKTSEIKETHIIIEKDLPDWISYMNSLGFYEK